MFHRLMRLTIGPSRLAPALWEALSCGPVNLYSLCTCTLPLRQSIMLLYQFTAQLPVTTGFC